MNTQTSSHSVVFTNDDKNLIQTDNHSTVLQDEDSSINENNIVQAHNEGS